MKTRKILLVDDEPAFTRVMRNYLTDTGLYQVRMENDPTKAVAAAAEFRPDLILLDVIMPEMDGGEVAARLKDDPTLGQIPIVFLTAIVSKELVRSQGEIIGGNTFLAKPVNVHELLECVDRQLKMAA